jgi:hypothetical protein
MNHTYWTALPRPPPKTYRNLPEEMMSLKASVQYQTITIAVTALMDNLWVPMKLLAPFAIFLKRPGNIVQFSVPYIDVLPEQLMCSMSFRVVYNQEYEGVVPVETPWMDFCI